MTDGKPKRGRRAAEQMLVELKQRLREISDLNAAGSVLNWDQATYMPQAGAAARGRQLAMLGSLAHERAVAPALGRLSHYVQNTGDEDLVFLEMFVATEFQEISLNKWLRALPHQASMAHTNLKKEDLERISADGDPVIR